MTCVLHVYSDWYCNKPSKKYTLSFANNIDAIKWQEFLGKGWITEGIQLDLFKQTYIKE